MIALADTFSHAHIVLTAAITGVIALAAASLLLAGRQRVFDSAAIGILAGLAVYLWRVSANMPQLNNDGISGFSANDWLAPVVTYAALGVYAGLRAPSNPTRYARVRAIATIAALAVNVITI